jgi:hypothetical protein
MLESGGEEFGLSMSSRPNTEMCTTHVPQAEDDARGELGFPVGIARDNVLDKAEELVGIVVDFAVELASARGHDNDSRSA